MHDEKITWKTFRIIYTLFPYNLMPFFSYGNAIESSGGIAAHGCCWFHRCECMGFRCDFFKWKKITICFIKLSKFRSQIRFWTHTMHHILGSQACILLVARIVMGNGNMLVLSVIMYMIYIPIYTRSNIYIQLILYLIYICHAGVHNKHPIVC